MYLNPVGSSAYDRVFADMIEQYKYPATHADVVSLNPETVPPGMNNLEYRSYESFIVNDTVKAARYASEHDYDAMVIGCFYDPALHDAREISGNTVIVAPCQASIVTALNIANNFSILIGKTKWETQMRQAVHEYGFGDKLASFQSVDLRVNEFHKDPEETRKRLQAAAVEAVQVHKAESIILGCTLEIGFYRELQDYLDGPEAFPGAGIPVIDPSIAAFKAAENAALLKQYGWKNSRYGGMQPPPENELKAFNLFREDYEFGNVIHVPATTQPSGQQIQHGSE
ncbi:MAG: aspartate/glutamate racemase family protein [Gammaproteobacteria bacterium]|nr:aspartate/glutamate racemase family protein [Gammaproteobacteria bacterium]